MSYSTLSVAETRDKTPKYFRGDDFLKIKSVAHSTSSVAETRIMALSAFRAMVFMTWLSAALRSTAKNDQDYRIREKTEKPFLSASLLLL